MENIYLSFLRETVTFEFVLKFAVVYFFIIWIALIVWVIKDINNRTSSLLFQVLSVLIILFLTPLGVFIYLLIRPGKTLYERYYDEIEENLDIFQDIIEERKMEVEEKIKQQELKKAKKKKKENNFKNEALEIVNEHKDK